MATLISDPDSGSRRLVLVGGGGHASDVLDAVLADGRWTVVGIVDDQEIDRSRFADRAVGRVGRVDDLPSLGAHYVLAMGWPVTRDAMVRRISKRCLPGTVVHPGADIGSSTSVGEGSVVLAGARLSPGVQLGRHVLVSYLSSVGHDTVVGDFTSIMPGAHVAGDCVVGEGVLIGAGAIVLQGRTVGSGASVGAGAVVTRDVEAAATVVGVPARAVVPGAVGSE